MPTARHRQVYWRAVRSVFDLSGTGLPTDLRPAPPQRVPISLPEVLAVAAQDPEKSYTMLQEQHHRNMQALDAWVQDLDDFWNLVDRVRWSVIASLGVWLALVALLDAWWRTR